MVRDVRGDNFIFFWLSGASESVVDTETGERLHRLTRLPRGPTRGLLRSARPGQRRVSTIVIGGSGACPRTRAAWLGEGGGASVKAARPSARQGPATSRAADPPPPTTAPGPECSPGPPPRNDRRVSLRPRARS